MIPGNVLDFIEQTPTIELPGIPTGEHECQGAQFHSPRPMVVHPFEMSGPGSSVAEDEREVVHLCGTCLDNVRLLLGLMKEHDGEVPWVIKRCFGNLIRNVADAAYLIF